MKLLLIAALCSLPAAAQAPPAAQPPKPPATAKSSAAIDLTGYWVSFVTEDWRFRMMTPKKGDYQSVPLNDEGRKTADKWDPAADEASGNQCRAYGAGAIMRVPARFHVTWQDDETLRIDTDAGMQTRLFHFNAPQPQGERTWQGYSAAQWERPSSLKVTTTNLRPGYLRRNGVPYSENAVVTEYFDVAPHPDGGQVLLVTTIVDDPQYLRQPFIVSSEFKKEADGSKWDPTPCSAR